jgi:hypothetical protein
MEMVNDLQLNKIKTAEELKQAITRLELKNRMQWAELKEEANELYEKVAPVGNAVVAVSQLFSKPDLHENIFNTALSNITDFLAKRLIVRGSDNRFRIMLANLAKNYVLRFFASRENAIESTVGYIRDFVGEKIHRIKKAVKR